MIKAIQQPETVWDDDPAGDEVIREVHRIKEELARLHGFDVRRIAEDARVRQLSSGHPIIHQPLPVDDME